MRGKNEVLRESGGSRHGQRMNPEKERGSGQKRKEKREL